MSKNKSTQNPKNTEQTTTQPQSVDTPLPIKMRPAVVTFANIKPDLMLGDLMDQVEMVVISQALGAHANNKTTAAQALGISRTCLVMKLRAMRRFGVNMENGGLSDQFEHLFGAQ